MKPTTPLAATSQHRPARHASFGEAAADYAQDGGFVDWARRVITGGEPVKELAEAYAKLATVTTEVREAQNREFAELLRDWTHAGSRGKSLLRIEKVIRDVVAPLAQRVPVLVLLIDGMSYGVFQELLEDITSSDFVELDSEDHPVPPVVAAMPSVTSVCRASFFCGSLTEGSAQDESHGIAAHPALAGVPGAGREVALFHKVSVADDAGGGLTEEVRTKIASKGCRVVALVLNAVDDHLLKGDQTDPRWTRDYIRALPSLLYEAQSAGRAVVLLSDHGHVLERGTQLRKHGEAERWRPATSPPEEGEIAVEGSRVVAQSGKLIAPWSERLRYAGKKNGYHGGLTPQEMLVPLAILFAGDAIPHGWQGRSRYVPAWWEEPAAAEPPAGAPEAGEPGPETRAPRPGMLFDLEPAPVKEGEPAVKKAGRGPDWLNQLLVSEVYASQKAIAGRAVPANEIAAKLLTALAGRGGRMTAAALSRELGTPGFRFAGLLAAMQRVLNVEGYPILTKDDSGDTVELNIEMLRKQFELR